MNKDKQFNQKISNLKSRIANFKLKLRLPRIVIHTKAPKAEKKEEKKATVKETKVEVGKPTFMQSLRAMFAKKVVPETPVVIFKEPPSNGEIIESYAVLPSYSQVNVMSLPELGGGKAYFVDEVSLPDEERLLLRKISDIVSKEIEPPKAGVDPITHIDNEAKRLALKYGLIKKDKMSVETWQKILYYLHRDFLGFGHIHVIMNDPMIEDISVNGIGMPVYVWHRKYESMPTNLTFPSNSRGRRPMAIRFFSFRWYPKAPAMSTSSTSEAPTPAWRRRNSIPVLIAPFASCT